MGVDPLLQPDGYASELRGADDAHALGVLSVLPGSRVLDAGCGDGTVARLLADRDCVVTGIDISPDAARTAERWCERVLVGDLETLDLDAELGDATFDAVIALDVLEHLKAPGPVVEALASRLVPEGRFVTSIPNVTHAAVRLHLLEGRFEPAASGLLDRSHLHFFDRAAAESLLTDHGLAIIDRLRVRRGVTETEIPVDLSTVQPAVLDEILADPDAETYQFVLVAAPGSAGATAMGSLASALQRRLEDAVSDVRSGAAYARHLETALELATADRDAHAGARDEAEGKVGALAEQLAELDGVLRERLAELEVLYGELRHLQADLELKDAYALDLRSALTVAQEAAAEAATLGAELGRVHAQVKIEHDRRLEVEAVLQAVTGRAAYRLLSRAEAAVARRPVVRRAASLAARMLAR